MTTHSCARPQLRRDDNEKRKEFPSCTHSKVFNSLVGSLRACNTLGRRPTGIVSMMEGGQLRVRNEAEMRPRAAWKAQRLRPRAQLAAHTL